MSATAAQIAQLRRMISESTATTYTDSMLSGYIEQYPMIDQFGQEALEWDVGTEPPTSSDNADWVATYDLNAAAAEIWEEKAAALTANVDFSADGGEYAMSQKFAQADRMARRYRARRAARTTKAIMYPLEGRTDLEALDSDLHN